MHASYKEKIINDDTIVLPVTLVGSNTNPSCLMVLVGGYDMNKNKRNITLGEYIYICMK